MGRYAGAFVCCVFVRACVRACVCVCERVRGGWKERKKRTLPARLDDPLVDGGDDEGLLALLHVELEALKNLPRNLRGCGDEVYVLQAEARGSRLGPARIQGATLALVIGVVLGHRTQRRRSGAVGVRCREQTEGQAFSLFAFDRTRQTLSHPREGHAPGLGYDFFVFGVIGNSASFWDALGQEKLDVEKTSEVFDAGIKGLKFHTLCFGLDSPRPLHVVGPILLLLKAPELARGGRGARL